MYHHILVGLDESAGAQQAFESAMELARIHGATLTLLSVEEHLPEYAAVMGEVQETIAELNARFRQVQQAAVERAHTLGLAIDTLILAGSAAQAITRTAQAGGYDLVVIGAGKHGALWSGLLGSTADRAVETAPCTVLVVRHSPLNTWAGDVMQRGVLTVHPETPIAAVVELLIEHGIKAVPVVDAAGAVVGIITGGDLLERAGLQLRLSLQRQLKPGDVQRQLASLSASGRVAADVMTSEVMTIAERTPLREATRLMAQQHIKRLPVVDGDGRLMGILSRADVLRYIAAVAPAPPSPIDPQFQPVRQARYVSDVLDPTVPTVAPETPLDAVAAHVVNTALRRVVVIDPQRHILGIITDADLIGSLNEGAAASFLQVLRSHLPFLGSNAANQQAMADLHRYHAQDVMRPNPVVIAPGATIIETIQSMMEHHLKRLPVVDQQGRLVGLVDRQAILRALSQLP